MYIRFLREEFEESTGIFTMIVQPIEINAYEEFGDELGESAEDIGDTEATEGIVNYVLAKHAHYPIQSVKVMAGTVPLLTLPLKVAETPAVSLQVKHEMCLRNNPKIWGSDRIEELRVGEYLNVLQRINSSWYKVRSKRGNAGYVIAHPYYVEKELAPLLPIAGVRHDPSIQAVAPLTATHTEKRQAVVRVAESKLGSPYVWGHSEGKGQQGFDCSSFTQFVYSQALGYQISPVSREQAAYVGTPVPVDEMIAGDLLTFDHGGHVGIYVGNGRMISEGGGLGKVGYLRVIPGSYWRNRLTAVKRMFS